MIWSLIRLVARGLRRRRPAPPERHVERCDAHHDGHDCTELGACRAALGAMCERIGYRDRGERARPIDTGLTLSR